MIPMMTLTVYLVGTTWMTVEVVFVGGHRRSQFVGRENPRRCKELGLHVLLVPPKPKGDLALWKLSLVSREPIRPEELLPAEAVDVAVEMNRICELLRYHILDLLN